MDPNVFETANAGFAQVMYEEFLRDPASVDAEWRQLFESGVVGEAPALNGTGPGGAGTEPWSRRWRPPPDPPRHPPRLRQVHRPRRCPIKGPAARLVQNMNESLTVPTATTFRELPVAQLESARKVAQRRAQAGGPEREDLLHAPDRVGHRARHEAAPRHGPRVSPSRTESRCGSRHPASTSASPWTSPARTAAGGWWCRSSRARKPWTSPASSRPTKAWWRRRGSTSCCPTTSPAPRCRSPTPAGSAHAPRCRD